MHIKHEFHREEFILDDEFKSQVLRLVTMLESLDGIDLTDSEGNFLKWLSDWDQATADNFISIIKKARKKNKR